MLATLLRSLSWFMLIAAPFSASCSRGGGETLPLEARADRPDFPADTAFKLLAQQVAFGPRIPGQPGHERQLQWMRSYLAARADSLEVQGFTTTTTGGETLHLTNLIAHFQPERQDRVLLITHWDTRPLADQSADEADRQKPVPGANDGASGTAVLMQLADMLKKQPPPVGVDLLFVDGEDYGPSTADMFLGATYFVQHLPAGYKPLYGVLLDMIGDQQLHIPVEGYSAQNAPEVVQRVWSVARDLGYGDVFVPDAGGAISDDHVALNQGGIRTIDLIDFDYGPGNRFWHTPQDLPENTSAKSLGIVGEVMAELVYRGG
jgi:glutaminyl-peptide cyclotransferase